MDDKLILNIGQYEVGSPELGHLEIDCKPERMTIFTWGDLIAIQIPGTIAYVPRNDKSISPFFPQVLELHGSLFLGQHSTADLGAALAPARLPSFRQPNSKADIALIFRCDRRYLQDVEDQRAANPGSQITLGMSIEGMAAIVAPVSSATRRPLTEPQPTYQATDTDDDLRIGDSLPVVVGRLARVGIVNGWHTIEVSRSRWADELLKAGYPQRRVVEVPRIETEASLKEVRLAAEHLQSAHRAYLGDKFREAVQLCRQARDALIPGDNPTQRESWALDHFEPALGKQKALMVYHSVDALRQLGNAASHGEERNVAIEIDRDAAEYVIGHLTLILRYLDQKLR